MGYISDLRKIVGHRTLMMPCGCVIIGDGKGKILLQKRVDDGTWGYHGGAMEIDESSEEAARREAKEEANLDLGEMSLLGVYSGKKYHHVYPNGDHCSCIDIVYICHDYKGEMLTQKEEVSELRWFGKDDIQDNISINLQEAIADYFKLFDKKSL